METKTPTLKSYITDVPDFPKKGIIFKDLTSLLESPSTRTRGGIASIEWHDSGSILCDSEGDDFLKTSPATVLMW